MDFGPAFAVSAEIEIVVGAALADAPEQASTPIDLRTAAVPNTSGECLTARLEGTLAPTVTTGLGFRYPLDQLARPPLGSPVVVDVIWPLGWKAYRSDGEIVLFDDAGAFVARTGDRVAFGGGFVGPADAPSASAALVVEGFEVCGGLVELSPSP